MADNSLRSVDLLTKAVRTITRFGPGTVDGVRPEGQGNLLVSVFEGRVYRVTPSTGEVVKLLDTSGVQRFVADIEYVPERRLLVCPGWTSSGVTGYRLEPTRSGP